VNRLEFFLRVAQGIAQPDGIREISFVRGSTYPLEDGKVFVKVIEGLLIGIEAHMKNKSQSFCKDWLYE